MPKMMMKVAVPMLLAVMAVTSLPAQTPPPAGQSDPFRANVRLAHNYLRHQLTTAASGMTEEDYAFRPTPEVRTFGQLLGHIADNNYQFCAEAVGKKAPVPSVEKAKTTKADLDKALAESYAYCDGVYMAMTDSSAKAMVSFGNSPKPALVVLMFNSVHNALHYGNVVTYMRLRGKVPPPSAR